MNKLLAYILIVLALTVEIARADAPVVWNGTTVKWLPSGLRSVGLCSLDAAGVMTSRTLVSGDIPNNAADTSGNAATCTALASNPTDCGAGTKATAIDASGNLTCSAVDVAADITGVVPMANGGSNKNMTAVNGGLVYSDADSMEVTSAGTSGQAVISGGAGAPTFYAPTLGSVLFAGTGGILAEDNSAFFWDASNNRLGIGTASPGFPLEIVAASANETLLSLNPTSGSNVDFRVEGANFRIDQGVGTLFLAQSGNVNINSTVQPRWNVQAQKASTQTTGATFLNRDTGDPIIAVKNSSSTANNMSGLVFAGNSNTVTEGTSAVIGVHESHTGAAETGHLEFWTRNSGTVAKRMNIGATGTITASAYGAGVAQFDSSGVLSSSTTITADVTGNADTATALAANPSDCGSDTYATTIAASGNLTCASITNASTTASASAGNNTIVLRDGSGNFAAGTITAALTGNASTATALAANPAACGAGDFVTDIAADGTLTCDTPAGGGAIAKSQIRLSGRNGYGGSSSGDTKILNFSSVIENVGTAITYTARTTTAGDFFTINEDGVYAISYFDAFSASEFAAISLNSSNTSANSHALPAAEILGLTLVSAANISTPVSATAYLESGDIIRVQTTNQGVHGVGVNMTWFTIVKVSD